MITQKLCKKSTKKNSYNFRYVPDSKKTPELCLLAWAKKGYNFQYVPDSKK